MAFPGRPAQALWVRAPGGPRLALWDLAGGRREVGGAVLLVHGSGLNALCWLPVAKALAESGFRAWALDLRGHGRSGRSPGGDYGWERFADDVLAAAAQCPSSTPLLGAGHSAGAAALLLAEARQPGTFAAIWAWEPIVGLPGDAALHRRGLELADRARRRRSSFASLEAARSHLSGRGIFAEFSPEAFEGYLSGAFLPAPAKGGQASGLVLACDPEDEARTYEAAGAEGLWARLGQVGCPTKVLGGEQSPAVAPAEVEALAARLPAGEGAVLAGLGHFGPFQAPELVAADLAKWALALPRPPGGGLAKHGQGHSGWLAS